MGHTPAPLYCHALLKYRSTPPQARNPVWNPACYMLIGDWYCNLYPGIPGGKCRWTWHRRSRAPHINMAPLNYKSPSGFSLRSTVDSEKCWSHEKFGELILSTFFNKRLLAFSFKATPIIVFRVIRKGALMWVRKSTESWALVNGA